VIEIIHEYIVREGTQARFELTYGVGGAWSRLFSKSPGFRGIILLRDAGNPLRFLSIEIWEGEELRHEALASHQAEAADVFAALEEMVETDAGLGTFKILAEGTVRARGKPGQARRR
jgi:heme-degrading monooxygenase HmoA